MKISIIGTGNVGSALARGLKKSSHTVVLGARDIANRATQDLAADVGAELASPAEAAKSAELVVLALPWNVAEAAVKALGDLAGKIVIDCMNPLGMIGGVLGLMLGYDQRRGGRRRLAARRACREDAQSSRRGDYGQQCQDAAQTGHVHGRR